jgi:hypothetical protein
MQPRSGTEYAVVDRAANLEQQIGAISRPSSRRRSWRKLHIGVDADNGEIVAVAVTRKDIDDAAMADPLLDQIADPIASLTADGA